MTVSTEPKYPDIRTHGERLKTAIKQHGGYFADRNRLLSEIYAEMLAFGTAISKHNSSVMEQAKAAAKAAETEANERANRFMAENVAVHKRYTEKCYDVAERDKKLAARDEQIAELRKALNETNARLALALDTAATMERIITNALKGEAGE